MYNMDFYWPGSNSFTWVMDALENQRKSTLLENMQTEERKKMPKQLISISCISVNRGPSSWGGCEGKLFTAIRNLSLEGRRHL